MISDFFQSLNFFELFDILKSNYAPNLFPFLIVFAVLYTVISNISLFKKGNIVKKSVVFIISFIIAFYGTTFELSPGYSISTLLQMIFPNVSSLTIGILSLYILGAILGKNFLNGLFNPKMSSIMKLLIGGLGLASMIFYLGIAFGFWNYDYLNQFSYWNFFLLVLFIILGLVMMITGNWAIGIILLFVVITYIGNGASDSILSYFIDPVIFIIAIVSLLFQWMGKSKEDKIDELKKDIASYEKDFSSKKPKDYEDLIHDIRKVNYENNKKLLNKLLGMK
jgi:hypothetical protein